MKINKLMKLIKISKKFNNKNKIMKINQVNKFIKKKKLNYKMNQMNNFNKKRKIKITPIMKIMKSKILIIILEIIFMNTQTTVINKKVKII